MTCSPLPSRDGPAEIAPGFSLAAFEGGSVEQVSACARGHDVAALFACGRYFPGAPDFVNEAFLELFPHGLPPDTPLVAGSNGN